MTTQAEANRRHADCVRMSRENAVMYAERAEKEAARGNHERAAHWRESARKSREEADLQERCGAGRV